MGHPTLQNTELAKNEEMGGDMHKKFAYIKAANALRAHHKKVVSGEEAQKLPGIGPKVCRIVDT